LADTLKAQICATPALVPASHWLEGGAPDAPLAVLASRPNGELELILRALPSGKPVARWAVWLRYGDEWAFQTNLRPTMTFPAVNTQNNRAPLTGIVASALDRVGNESPRIGLLLLPGNAP
jgi:hypothetical protein